MPGTFAGEMFNCGGLSGYRDTSLRRTPPLHNPTVAVCPGTFGDPRGVGVYYDRGTHVRSVYTRARCEKLHSIIAMLGRGGGVSGFGCRIQGLVFQV